MRAGDPDLYVPMDKLRLAAAQLQAKLGGDEADTAYQRLVNNAVDRREARMARRELDTRQLPPYRRATLAQLTAFLHQPIYAVGHNRERMLEELQSFLRLTPNQPPNHCAIGRDSYTRADLSKTPHHLRCWWSSTVAPPIKTRARRSPCTN